MELHSHSTIERTMIDVALLNVRCQKQRISGITTAPIYGWKLARELFQKHSSTSEMLTNVNKNCPQCQKLIILTNKSFFMHSLDKYESHSSCTCGGLYIYYYRIPIRAKKATLCIEVLQQKYTPDMALIINKLLAVSAKPSSMQKPTKYVKSQGRLELSLIHI